MKTARPPLATVAGPVTTVKLMRHKRKPSTRAVQARANDNAVLQHHADEIRSLAKRTVENVIEIGRLLTDAKERIPHGRWLSWLEREFGWSADTATNFMNVYNLSKRPKFRKFRNLTRIAPSVLYALARAPEEDAERIMERIERGERVPISQIREAKPTVVATERTDRVVVPYWYGPKAEGEPISLPAPPRQEHLPEITSEDIRRAHVPAAANRLIDELACEGADREICEKAVELVLDKRRRDYERFAQAVRQLAAALDRSKLRVV
jgi:hypothetical protein